MIYSFLLYALRRGPIISNAHCSKGVGLATRIKSSEVLGLDMFLARGALLEYLL